VMSCQRCNSERLCSACGKCNDTFSAGVGNNNMEGYVPTDLGIGGGDYLEISYCLDCGQLQGKFPLPPSTIEKVISDQEALEFFENNFSEGEYVTSNYSRKQDVIADAKDTSLNLSVFIEEFFRFNKGKECPSPAKLVEMFRSNDPQI
jgi:hypothetical protein